MLWRECDRICDCVCVRGQYDSLFDNLSVREHLQLFAGIKGMASNDRTERAISQLIEEVGLTDKQYSHAGSLSGGQKRRLSVALALIGDPKVAVVNSPHPELCVVRERCVYRSLLPAHVEIRCRSCVTR